MKTDKEKAILGKLAMLLYAKQAASSPAWQRSECKNPEEGELSKTASKATRRIMQILKASDQQKKQKIMMRLRDYGLERYFKGGINIEVPKPIHATKGLVPDTYTPHKLSQKFEDNLLSKRDKFHDISRRSIKGKRAHPLERRYLEMFFKTNRPRTPYLLELERENMARKIKAPPASYRLDYVRPGGYSEQDIKDIMEKGISSVASSENRSIFEHMKALVESKRDSKRLVAQFKPSELGVKDLLFTPHFGKPNKADRLVNLWRMHVGLPVELGGRHPRWGKKPNYETVISRAENLSDPTKRLRATRYYIPTKTKSKGSVLARRLPDSDKGYVYKGGTQSDLLNAKNLTENNGYFFTGIPQVSAGYANKAKYLKPAGFKELRKYLNDKPLREELYRYYTPEINIDSSINLPG
jgi:hypothetical protein